MKNESMSGAVGVTAVNLVTWTVSVPSGAREVADALRFIAQQIEDADVCLVSIYNTGFGEPHEAALQVVVEDVNADP